MFIDFKMANSKDVTRKLEAMERDYTINNFNVVKVDSGYALFIWYSEIGGVE